MMQQLNIAAANGDDSFIIVIRVIYSKINLRYLIIDAVPLLCLCTKVQGSIK